MAVVESRYCGVWNHGFSSSVIDTLGGLEEATWLLWVLVSSVVSKDNDIHRVGGRIKENSMKNFVNWFLKKITHTS